ncbi:MAG: aminopeptidase, partial [Acidobacteria bacterium]|nr:aminopeptidase [Acidobacteriota bacterium]
MRIRLYLALLLTLCCAAAAYSQSKSHPSDKFKQLGDELATPNDYRAASGAPGNRYWQQRADYAIDVELDDLHQRITGKETVTYHNLSPDSLSYLWLQVDQNIWAKDSDTPKTQTAPSFDKLPFHTIDNLLALRDFDG